MRPANASQSPSTSAARDGKSRAGQASPGSRQKGGLRSTYVFTTRPPSSSGQAAPAPPLPVYPSLFKQPFQDPLEALCHAYSLKKLAIAIDAADGVPERVAMQLLPGPNVYTPTHALAVLDTRRAAESKEAQSILYPLIVPIDADVFDKAFNNEIVRHFARGTRAIARASTHIVSDSAGTQTITLPTITTRVPHPPSLPLLILFGLAPHLELERMSPPTVPSPSPSPPSSPSPSSSRSPPPDLLTADYIPPPLRPITSPLHRQGSSPAHLHTGLLSTYLLPVTVIEEFPAAAVMADVMARTCSDDELAAYVVQNQGLWRNALLLAPQDSAIIEIVRTAWNVTAEARRLKDKEREEKLQARGAPADDVGDAA